MRTRAIADVQRRVDNRRRRKPTKWDGDVTELPEDVAIVVKGFVSTTPADLVFDEAAQVTVLSKRFHERMGSPKLTKIDGGPQTADGSSLKVIGALKIDVKMGEEAYPYRAWVIENLQFDILLGLDFKTFYEVDTLQSTRELKIGPRTIPFVLEGWGRKRQRNLRSKVQVMATETLHVPVGYGRDIPVQITSRVPKEWKGRLVSFVPSRAAGLEVAKGVLDASQETWPVRTLNLGNKDVCVEAGTILGHIEVQDKGCSISSIRVPGETPQTNRTKHQSKTSGKKKVNEEGEKTEQHDRGRGVNAEREEDCEELKESKECGDADLVVPGVPKDLKLGPVSGVVTRGSGGRPAEVPETSLGCGVPQPGELRLPPRHALGHTPKDQRSIGEVREASEMVGEEPRRENQKRPSGPTERKISRNKVCH